MIPRGKLDIPYSALIKSLGYCITDLAGLSRTVAARDNTLICLSVRTGLDLTLRSLNLLPGSEILMSGINIPDMFAIVKAHQLQIIPLAINRHSLNLSATEMLANIGPATKGILITHLFGAITDTDELIKLAKQHNLFVIEDCAQAFDGSYKGHPQSDVVMFSFGLIKTNTSLTGAMLRINNAALYNKMVSLNESLPLQHTSKYLKKVGKGFILKLMTSPWLYTLLYLFSRWKGKDFDDLLAGFTRGFPGEDVLAKVQYRPCAANVKLLQSRLAEFDKRQLNKRASLGNEILNALTEEEKVGDLCQRHTHWVVPVRTTDPIKVIEHYRSLGIDATAKASTLVQLAANDPETDNLDLIDLVYLPLQPGTLSVIRSR